MIIPPKQGGIFIKCSVFVGALLSADYMQRIAMCVIAKGMDNQRSPRWFSTPFESPLSFGLCPTRAQGRRSGLRLPALFAPCSGAERYRPTLTSLGGGWLRSNRVRVCGAFNEGGVFAVSSANLFPAPGSASGAKQGGRVEREEGGEPTQLVPHPPRTYASLGAPWSADTLFAPAKKCSERFRAYTLHFFYYDNFCNRMSLPVNFITMKSPKSLLVMRSL